MSKDQLTGLPYTQAWEEGSLRTEKGDGCQPSGSENASNDGKTFSVEAASIVKSDAIDFS